MSDNLPTGAGHGGKETYRPWVAVVLSFFITGAAQFVAGKRRLGVAWYVGLGILAGVGFVCMASPMFAGVLPGITLVIIAWVLWIFMLVRSYQPIPKLRRSGWLLFIALWALLSWASFQSVRLFARPYVMPSASMSPTIRGTEKLPDGTSIRGDHFFVIRYAYWFNKPERGDIVVFKTAGISPQVPPDELFVKRIIGLPGDILSVRNGRLYLQGQPVSQPAILAQMNFTNAFPENQKFLKLPTDDFQVPAGSYFVVGDNTGNSFDSRYWGALPAKNIVGRVSKIYWPLNRIGSVE